MAITINGTTGVAGVDGSASTPAVQGTDTNTGVSFGTDTVKINTGGTTRATVDSSGNLGIGTTSPSQQLTMASSGDSKINIKGHGSSTGYFIGMSSATDAQIYNAENGFLQFATNDTERVRITSSGGIRIGATDDPWSSVDDVLIATSGDTGVTIRSGTSSGGHIVFADGTSGSDRFRGFIDYKHSDDSMRLGTNDAERIRISSSGAVSVGSTANTYGGSILAANGYYVSSFNGDNLITNASQGGGSATLYIGNAAIQVSSDQRIKKDIVDTTLDATTKLKQVRVVDFKWNDPTDKAEVNRNSRGTWTGCLAQEMVNVFPYTVNAPRKDDNSIDTESERTWGLEYQHLVPALIKGFQEQQAKIETLETKVAALEAA